MNIQDIVLNILLIFQVMRPVFFLELWIMFQGNTSVCYLAFKMPGKIVRENSSFASVFPASPVWEILQREVRAVLPGLFPNKME